MLNGFGLALAQKFDFMEWLSRFPGKLRILFQQQNVAEKVRLFPSPTSKFPPSIYLYHWLFDYKSDLQRENTKWTEIEADERLSFLILQWKLYLLEI